MLEERRVLLPQPIESRAVSILEEARCKVVLSPDPEPATVAPLIREAHGLISAQE